MTWCEVWPVAALNANMGVVVVLPPNEQLIHDAPNVPHVTLVTVPEPLAPDCVVHVLVAVQTFSPYVAPDVVTKYCWPTEHVAGRDAPTVTMPAPTTHKPG
jgi:hypothetical protein